MLYLFCCTTPGCLHSTALRVQLPEANGFHPADDMECRKNVNKHLPRGYNHDDLCGVCGLKTEGQRCPVQEMYFCSRVHQKDYMKNVTKLIMADKKEGTLQGMFDELKVEVFADEGEDEEDEEEKEKREVRPSEADLRAGTAGS